MTTAIKTNGSQGAPASPPSDEALLLRYRNERDEDAFRELMTRYENQLYHYLCRYLHDAAGAEEVLQAAFLRVAQHSDRFLPGHRVGPWLYTIATHLAIDALRHAKRHPAKSLDAEHGDEATLMDLLVARADDPSAHLDSEERSAWLHQAMNELPEHLRDALDLVYFRGLKYSDAARRLDIPLGTLKSRLHESLIRLHDAAGADA